MEKKEQEMLEKIRSASEELQVPEALEPERVKEMLERREREKPEGKGNSQGFRRSIQGRQIAALAAGLAAVCLAGAAYTLSVREGSADPVGDFFALPDESGGADEETKETEVGELVAAKSYDDIYAYLETVLLYMPDYKNEPEGIEELMPWSDMIQQSCQIKSKS